MKFMRWLTPAKPIKTPIDLTRRHFIFGAAATIILPPERTFHFLPKQEILLPEAFRLFIPEGKLFDLPSFESRRIADKLIDGTYKLYDIPRWVVHDKRWYDEMVAKERAAA